MNETIHLVAKGWYRLFYGVMLGFCVLVAGGYFLAQHQAFAQWGQSLGFDLTGCVLALTQIVYSLSAYWIVRRYGEAVALLGCSMLFSLVILNGIMRTDPSYGAWIYVGASLATSFLVGMYGLQLAVGSLLVPSIYVLLHYNFDPTLVSMQSWVLLVGSGVAVTLTYGMWRRSFVNPERARVDQLSGMLRSNQEQSAILIQSIADGVIVINTEGKITLINPAAASMTQWAVSEATGIDVQLVVKVTKEKGEDIAEVDNPFNVVLTKKSRVNQTLLLTGREGKQVVISLVIAPISVGESNTKSHIAGAVAVLRDVSTERAEEQQRAEFISTASHEMRTPVAAIEGYLALALNEKVSSIDARARSFLEKAHSSTQHLGQLFQDLLTSAKAEDGRLSNHPAVIEMGSFLQQLVEDLRFGAQKKNLVAEFVIGTGETIDATSGEKEHPSSLKMVKPLYYVWADPDRLREVITNLFDNAVKYTEQGKVSVGLTGNTEVVQFYIRDTGNGIPAEDIPHLFQKFYRVDNSATRTIGGTGLGLFISRKIIELYKGRVWVESQLGKGSTFFINLPRLSAQRAAQLQNATTVEPDSAPSSATVPKS